MKPIIPLPVSNADSEREFSILRKLHTDQRPRLKQDTIIALMTITFNPDASCFDSIFSDELLTHCKKATSLAHIHPKNIYCQRNIESEEDSLMLLLSLLFSTFLYHYYGCGHHLWVWSFLVGVVCVLEGIFEKLAPMKRFSRHIS